MFKYGVVTDAGLQVLGAAVGGKKLTYTRIEYGDGEHDDLVNQNTEEKLNYFLQTIRAVKNKTATLSIHKVKNDGAVTTITGNVEYESVQADFYAKEAAIFGKVEGSEEVLIAYYTSITYIDGERKDTSDYIAKNALLGQDHRLFLSFLSGNTPNIHVEYSQDNYVTMTELQENVEQVVSQVAIKPDIIIDSDAKLLEWASCKTKDLKFVYIKNGTYTLNDRMVNLLNSGTKYILGEYGCKLIFNYQKGIGVGEDSEETFVIENVEIEVNNTSEDYDGYGIYYGAIAKNCKIKVKSTYNNSYGFKGCTVDNCDSVATGTAGYAYYDCSYCTRAKASSASTTATWGGTNTKIDTDTCD